MSPDEIRMHLAAGRYYGQHATCGTKIKHPTLPEAERHANSLNRRVRRSHDVEAYPCYWCSPDKDNGDYIWHVGRRMYQHERDLFSGPEVLNSEVVDISYAEHSLGIQQGIVGLRVHSRKLCEDHPCCIHHPSDHHMQGWPLNWRADRKIMERICLHGVGHPDPDDADFRAERDGDKVDSGVHGCDGCCFKGGK